MSDVDLAEQRVGRVLRGKWTLERLIGVGGMAAVYVARHKIGRLDAIKILHPEFSREEQIRLRFEQEAHVLNRFKHPGAVEVRDLEKSDDGAPFMVMELLDGQSLAARLRSGPTPSVEETLRVADEVLDVLAAAHAEGIIHRDIKPDNLFILPSGAVKVLDFGIARARSDNGGPLKTKTGVTLGTPAYMPAEQLKGVDIDGRADVYAVGATMFRMLAGKTPHTAKGEIELLMKVLMEPAPRLETVAPEVRADVARVVDRALSFDRDARYPDPRSMQSEVRAARTSPDAQSTRASAPGSALIRAAVPESRHVTRLSNDPPPVSAARTGIVTPPETRSREVLGVPLVWLVAVGVVALMLVGGGIAAVIAFALPNDAPTVIPKPRSTAPTMTPAQPRDRPADDWRRRQQ